MGAWDERRALRPWERTLGGDSQWGSHAGNFSLGWGVTELPGSQRPPTLPAPSPSTPRRRLTKTRAREADCSQGWGWVSAPRVLTASAPPSGRSPSWTRSSCTAWRMCVAAPDTSVVSGEGKAVGRARVGQPGSLGDCGHPACPSSESPRVPEPRAGGDAAGPDRGGALGRRRVPYLPLH